MCLLGLVIVVLLIGLISVFFGEVGNVFIVWVDVVMLKIEVLLSVSFGLRKSRKYGLKFGGLLFVRVMLK